MNFQEKKLKKKNILINIVLAYAMTFAIYNIGNFSPSDITLGIIFVGILLVLGKTEATESALKPNNSAFESASACVHDDKRLNLISNVAAAIWTLSYWIYAGDSLKNGLENKAFAGFYIIMTIGGLYVITFYVMKSIISFCSKKASDFPRTECPETEINTTDYLRKETSQTESQLSGSPSGIKPGDTSAFLRKLIFASLIVFICLLPLFLLNFPGTMTVDSFDQLSQARGLKAYSNHHPWVHTLVIKLFYMIGFGITGNVTAGIATYTIAQMVIVSMSIGYAVASVDELGFNRTGQWIIILGFVLFPYNLAYSITMWKDIIFSAGVLVFGITLYRIFVAKLAIGARDTTLFVLTGLIMCLFRHNGYYAYILTMLIILICYFVTHKKGRFTLTVLAATIFTILSTVIINGPVQRAFDVEPGDYGHNLAIPLQQIGRVVAYNGEITAEELGKIERINTAIYIRNNYQPGGADNMIQWLVAGNAGYLHEHRMEYFALWLSLGLRNPVAYWEAFAEQTKGYYTTMMPEQIAYYGILPNKDKLDSYPLLGAGLRIKIDEICSKLQDVLPVYAIFYSVGACVLLLILCSAIAIYSKRRELLTLYLPYFALILSIIVAAPLVADLRYGYSLMLSVPTLIVLTLRPIFTK